MVLLGCGSFGIVLSNPRVPTINESYGDIMNLNQVSKILYYIIDNDTYKPSPYKDFKFEYDDILLLCEQYHNVFNTNYFMLPINGGILDKKKFIEKYNDTNTNYNFEWLSKSKKTFKIINSLLKSYNDIYQIIYAKGDIVTEDINIFIDQIKNIFELVILSDNFGFYFDDIKLQNLVTHDNKIKIIDFSCPINTNTTYDQIINQIVNSKLCNIYYFPYPIITNIILYEQINMLELISPSPYKKNYVNYYSILKSQSIQDKQNLKYKFKLVKKLLSMTNLYFQNYKKEIKLLNFNMISKINSIEDIDKYSEYKTIDMKDFCVSAINLLLIYVADDNESLKDLINKIFIGYNKLINQIFHNNNQSLDKIIFLLKNIILHSFGLIFIEWIYKNVNLNDNLIISKDIIEKMFDIIILFCTNYVVIDDNLFFSFPNFNIEKLNFFSNK
jgi:hypothetical protein